MMNIKQHVVHAFGLDEQGEGGGGGGCRVRHKKGQTSAKLATNFTKLQ